MNENKNIQSENRKKSKANSGSSQLHLFHMRTPIDHSRGAGEHIHCGMSAEYSYEVWEILTSFDCYVWLKSFPPNWKRNPTKRRFSNEKKCWIILRKTGFLTEIVGFWRN
jgi:hypothetical protein